MEPRSNTSTPLSQATYYTPSLPPTALAPREKRVRSEHLQSPPASVVLPKRRSQVESKPARLSQSSRIDDISDPEITPTRQQSIRRQVLDNSAQHQRSSSDRYASTSPRTSSSGRDNWGTSQARQSSSSSTRAQFTRADDRSPLQKLELELKHISKEEGLVGTQKPQNGVARTRSLSKKQEERLVRSTTVTSRITSREFPGPIFDPAENRMMTDSPAPFTEGSMGDRHSHTALNVPQSIPQQYGQNVGQSMNGSFGDRTRQQDHTDGIYRAGGQTNLMVNAPSVNSSNSSAYGQDHSGTPQLVQATGNGGSAGQKNVDRSKGHGIHFHRSGHGRTKEPEVIRQNMHHDGGQRRGPNGPIVRLTTADQHVPELGNQYREEIREGDGFNPPLTLKCGPLLRYLGLRQEQNTGNPTEVWRGSIMIVTIDSGSTYNPAPTLRLFVQSAPPPSNEDITEIPAEAATTFNAAGEKQVILPTTEVDIGKKGKDLSHEEGLGELVKPVGAVNGANGNHSLPQQPRIDGEKSGKYTEGNAQRLHQERGYTFWRFNIEIELQSREQRIAYKINNGPAVGFYVPAVDQTMNIMFHSCNGFSASVNPDEFNGPDPLWRDVMRAHVKKPYHVMLGGGDQLYNDCVMTQTTHFKEWLTINKTSNKRRAEFTKEMKEELEVFYLERYAMWFSQGLFGVANGQIPMINIWDDHDIIDGFGSYNPKFNSCPVFAGLGNVAFKYYMLFQQQTLVDEGENEEPSWLLGSQPGPYITEHSRSNFMFLGRRVAFLGLDCRTERTRELLVGDKTYSRVFQRLEQEIISGQTRHLIVLLGVPIAYPRLVWLENILTSSVMHPLTYLGALSHGTLNGFLNKFDGSVELVDDMMDHWTARGHKAERNWFILELQRLAQKKGIRVTFLGGDVHLATFGYFRSKASMNIPKAIDHRYMVNVVSSAIVNTPPPGTLADLLNKRNKIHRLAHHTYETQIKIFFNDTKGKKRNNNTTLPARNYCTISENTSGHPIQARDAEITEPDELEGDEMDRFGGLDCVINCEIDQHDPVGRTKGYGLTVPVLEFAKGEHANHPGLGMGNQSMGQVSHHSGSSA